MSFHLQKGSCHQGKKMFEINQAKPIPTALKDMSCNNSLTHPKSLSLKICFNHHSP